MAPRVPRQIADFLGLPERRQETILRAYSVVSRLRAGEGWLRGLSREEQTTPRTVRRIAGSALRKTSHGRWAARGSDQLRRPMRVISTQGVVESMVRSSGEATLDSRHANVVGRFLANDPRAREELRQFRGERVGSYALETDEQRLKALARRGVLAWPEIYAHGN